MGIAKQLLFEAEEQWKRDNYAGECIRCSDAIYFECDDCTQDEREAQAPVLCDYCNHLAEKDD